MDRNRRRKQSYYEVGFSCYYYQAIKKITKKQDVMICFFCAFANEKRRAKTRIDRECWRTNGRYLWRYITAVRCTNTRWSKQKLSSTDKKKLIKSINEKKKNDLNEFFIDTVESGEMLSPVEIQRKAVIGNEHRYNPLSICLPILYRTLEMDFAGEFPA